MKMSRGKLLFAFLIYFFVQKGVLVHSSTEGHSIAARTDGAFEQSNFTKRSESGAMVVGSEQYDVRITNNKLKVATAPARENPVVEGPSDSKVETDRDQNSGPGLPTFVLFLAVIVWLTNAGGAKEN